MDIKNKELKINNDVLQNDLNLVTKNKEKLNIKNKKLKINLKETKRNLEDSLEKNRSFETNNAEHKNIISRHIVNSKKLQEKLNLVEESENLKLENDATKVKFYQDENIRLSSELLSTQKKNEITKENLNNIEICKVLLSVTKNIHPKNSKIKIKFVKDRPGHDLRYALNSNKIKKKLGWKPKTNFANGIRMTFEWYLNNNNYYKSLSKKDIHKRLGAR